MLLRKKKYDQGQYKTFPRHRRLILEICNASRTVPTFAIDRQIDLAMVSQARKETAVRIGWAAIFARAYSLVAVELPQLRQTFMSYPWPRLYEHPFSIVSISVNRKDEATGEDRLIFSRIRSSERLSLAEIQGGVSNYQTNKVDELFKEGQLLDAAPYLVRKAFWHLLMRWMGRKRARLFGTFSVSTLASYGTTNHSHPLITTSSLSYGPIDENGTCRVTLQADHRVLDGAILARAMIRLEQIMNTVIVEELRAISGTRLWELRKAC